MPVCDTSHWKVNLGMLWISQLLVMSGFAAMIPFIPLYMKTELGITDEKDLAFFVAMFNVFGTAAYAVFTPVNGMLGDRFGLKLMLLRGTFVTAFFFPLMGYVSSAWLLVFLRFITAACAGTTAASQAMLGRTVPDGKQGFALGMLTTAYWGGAMLGNVIGGLIIHWFNYTAAFWVCGIMYFLAGFAILPTRDNLQKSVVKKLAAEPETPFWKKNWFGWFPRFALPVWLVLSLMFLLGISRHFEAPFVALKVEALTSSADAAYWTGIVSAVVSVGAILSGLVTGYLADRIAPSKLFVPMLAIGGIMVALQGWCAGVWSFCVYRTFAFFVCGGMHPVLLKLLTSVTPQDQRGSAFGFSTSFLCLGGTLSAVLAGWSLVCFSLNGVFYTATVLLWLLVPVFIIVNRNVQKGGAEALRKDGGR
ncbi:MAG: MFS transporter [Lentisphaeria bacterium]|nr:MFS transporter [Lentisphaeria bacterium]